MRRIHKFPLETTDLQYVKGRFEKLLTVQDQRGTACLWAIENFEMPEREIAVYCYGTGFDIGIVCTSHSPNHFLGTIQQANGSLVWHFFS